MGSSCRMTLVPSTGKTDIVRTLSSFPFSDSTWLMGRVVLAVSENTFMFTYRKFTSPSTSLDSFVFLTIKSLMSISLEMPSKQLWKTSMATPQIKSTPSRSYRAESVMMSHLAWSDAVVCSLEKPFV